MNSDLLFTLAVVPTVVLGRWFGQSLARHLASRSTAPPLSSHGVLVFGAGRHGETIIRSMLAENDGTYIPVGLLDDSPARANREIMGLQVLGNRNDIGRAAKATHASILLVAVPSANPALVGELQQLAAEAGLGVRVLPSMSEPLDRADTGDVRELTEADLLGRPTVPADLESIAAYITNKRVLVTGAGGSVGSEVSPQLIGLMPAKLLMLDRDESALHGLQLFIWGRTLLDPPDLILADIRDPQLINEIFAVHKPQVVFHAAALKHLTLLERHPDEGAKTNVLGTRNVLDAAVKNQAERFVNISSSAAANPVSVLGRTQLVAEGLTAKAAIRSGRKFFSVRFGNALGSRGSILHAFRSQIESGGPVTVPDPEASRFFITISEAARLTLQAGAVGEPGEVMSFDMGGPVRIVDLARRLIEHFDPSVRIEFTGLRPGERLHEIGQDDYEVGYAEKVPGILHLASTTLAPGLDDWDDWNEVMSYIKGGEEGRIGVTV